MAESIVQVTEGAGKKLHTFQRTIGANNVEDEVVLLGENYNPTYAMVTSTAGTSTATANSHLAQLMAGASLKVRVRRIEVYQAVAVTTATILQVGLYRLTTAGTGGTAVTPSPHDTTDAASGATAQTLPTVKGTEAALVRYAARYMMQTVAASADLSAPLLAWDFDLPRAKPLIIAAGATNGIALKNLNGVAAGLIVTTIIFDETNF